MQSGGALRLYSTFVSLNGEVCESHQGSMCSFVRFAGCNLRCAWCDTVYAQEDDVGYQCNVHDIISLIREQGARNVTITGGEPFMQPKPLEDLCFQLVSMGFRVSVETNGSISFLPIEGVNYVVDFKLPASGEYRHMKVDTPWMHLRHNDWIKFVVADVPDYETACATMDMLKRKGCQAQYAISPVTSTVSVNRILQWLKLDRRFDVVISVQIHKLIDLNEPS